MKNPAIVAFFTALSISSSGASEYYNFHQSDKQSYYDSRIKDRNGRIILYPNFRGVEKNATIVDFQTASNEIKTVCGTTIYEPISRQHGSFGGEAYGFVEYDVNERGRAVNIHYREDLSLGTDHIKLAALRDIVNTVFKPPRYNNKSLYCENVSQRLWWFAPAINQRSAIRQRPGSLVKRIDF